MVSIYKMSEQEQNEVLRTYAPRKYNNLRKLIQEFMDSDELIAEMRYGKSDYTNAESFVTSLFNACKKSGEPVVTLRRRDRVFLLRTDK